MFMVFYHSMTQQLLALPWYKSRTKEYAKIRNKISKRYHKLRIGENTIKYTNYQAKVRRKIANRKSTLRLKVVNFLGGECVRCGVRDLRCLQLDHINGEGEKHDEKYHDRALMYRYYLNHPEVVIKKYQILCANCNWIKRYENHESKHDFPYGLLS